MRRARVSGGTRIRAIELLTGAGLRTRKIPGEGDTSESAITRDANASEADHASLEPSTALRPHSPLFLSLRASHQASRWRIDGDGDEWRRQRQRQGGRGGAGGGRHHRVPGHGLLAAADHRGARALARGHPLQRLPRPRLALPLPAPRRRPVRPRLSSPSAYFARFSELPLTASINCC
jgi:hypothetical protein